MDYGTPKVLPVTGAGVLFAGTLYGQFIVVACVTGLVICAALLIRALFRRKQSIGE